MPGSPTHGCAGQVINQGELSFVHSRMLPAFKGVDAVAKVEGLCNRADLY